MLESTFLLATILPIFCLLILIYRDTIENRPKCLDEHPDVDVRYLPASCIEEYAQYFHDSLYDYYNLRHYELNRAKEMQEDRESIDEKLRNLADDPD